MSNGVPIIVLHEAEDHLETCETNTGEVFGEKLITYGDGRGRGVRVRDRGRPVFDETSEQITFDLENLPVVQQSPPPVDQTETLMAETPPLVKPALAFEVEVKVENDWEPLIQENLYSYDTFSSVLISPASEPLSLGLSSPAPEPLSVNPAPLNSAVAMMRRRRVSPLTARKLETLPKRVCRRKLIPRTVTTSRTTMAAPAETTTPIPTTRPDQPGPSRALVPTRRNRYAGMSDAEIQAVLALTVDSDDDEESSNQDLEPLRSRGSRQLYLDSDDDEEVQEPIPPAAINIEWEPEVVTVPDPFHFEWRAFSRSPVDPRTRRLPFDDSACGPTFDPATPYDAFVQIWDQSIAEHIVRETNDYAQLWTDCRSRGLEGYKELAPDSRILHWQDVTVDGFYRFLAILLAMGMVIKSSLEEYWDSNTESVCHTPGFARVVPINKFLLFTRYLNFNSIDPDQPPPESLSRLFKLQPLLTHLNSKFQSLYQPSRNLALDESLTLWKGWLSIKQFIKNKAASVGVKSYEVCESKTGYLYRFELHANQHVGSSETPISGTVPSLVLRLLEGLEHRGHTVWMDSYYNSPALARELRNRGFDCAGTLRLNRELVPTQLATITNDCLSPGEVRGCTSGDVDLVVWRGRRRVVALISTYHGMATAMHNGALMPSIVPDYNLCMGGVDTKDQVLAMYPVERTWQRVWYKKMFRRLLNVSVHNAYVIFKAKHKITHRKFRYQLIDELLRRHRDPAPTRPLPVPALSISSLNLATSTTTTIVPETPTLAFCSLGFERGYNRTRRVCKVCRGPKRLSSYCKRCKVFLCMEPCFDMHAAAVLRASQSP